MSSDPFLLSFSGEQEAYLFFDAAGSADSVTIASSQPTDVTFFDENGAILADSVSRTVHRLTFPGKGVYRARLAQDANGVRKVSVVSSGTVIPFLMNGLGVLWDHGMLFPLLISNELNQTVYVWNDPAFGSSDSPYVPVVKGIPYGERAVVTDDRGNALVPSWYPKLGRAWFWHSAELASGSAYFRIDLDCSDATHPIRLTEWNGYAVSLAAPIRPLAAGTLTPAAFGDDGERLDARYELYIGDTRVLMYDILDCEAPSLTVPAGVYTLKVTHGVCYSEYAETVRIEAGKDTAVRAALSCVMPLPSGWALGELHTHSAFEDATAFPRQVMRAARANGRQFCFQTDKDVDALLAYGTHHYDVPGRFLGMPGQEIMCYELHMNVLNVDHRFSNPEADRMGSINMDSEERIRKWIDEYLDMKTRRPCLIMHNHPSHRPEVMPSNGYFRSWWVSDAFREFDLVENCDYQGWFDRLNHGRVLHGAWTGDGHDCSLMYPGKEGVCVHVGDTLSEETVISALERGDFFSTRAPGVMLQARIGGTGMGGTADGRDGRPLTLSASVSAREPIDVIELVVNGKVFRSIPGEGRERMELSLDVPENAYWALLRVRLTRGQWEQKTHSFTPFMSAGYDAFTNPIFIRKT